MAKKVKLLGGGRNGKMLKPTGPEIGANGKMVKLTSDKMDNGKMVKLVWGQAKWQNLKKPTGPKIDTHGKMAAR